MAIFLINNIVDILKEKSEISTDIGGMKMDSLSYDYDNIMSLAKKHNFKKIMIMRNSWSNGNWCIVNKVVFKPDKKYGYAYGHIHYANGNKYNGGISCAGTYVWRVIKVLDEDMEIKYMEK